MKISGALAMLTYGRLVAAERRRRARKWLNVMAWRGKGDGETGGQKKAAMAWRRGGGGVMASAA